jgi:hypothetical protein
MKYVFSLFIICFLFNFNSNSQINSTFLAHNNVSAHISDAGTYFTNFVNQGMGYEVPKGSGIQAIYSTQFWFAGKDGLDSLHFVQGGAPSQGRDIFNGPFSGAGTYTSPEYQTAWSNSMWSICQSDIDQYKLWWGCNAGIITAGCGSINPPSNEALQTIYDWPAHGDVSSGQSFYLAPFYDYDADGIYDPNNGDYPIIKGCCATYLIQNDVAEGHSYTNTDSIGIELHIMFYQYQTWDYLNDVTFIDIKAINRGGINYPEFAHSIFVDADLGYYGDDFFGCDSVNNVMYFYNADNNDDEGFPASGYGIDPPALGIVSLKEEMTSCAYFMNGGGNLVSEKWNIMNGLQFLGNPWLNPFSNETQFVYSGNPNITSEWSEISNGNPSGDRRGISSTSIGAFNIGDTLFQSYAIVYAREGNNLANVQSIIDLASDVKTFFDNESNVPCINGTWNVLELESLQIEIAPNPSSGIFYISSAKEKLTSIVVYNNQGKIVKVINPFCFDQIELDLSNQSNGFYLIHIKSEKGISVQKIIIE